MGFPAEGFHNSRTASWFYSPFFLQAANQGAAVIDLHIRLVLQQQFHNLMLRAIAIPTIIQNSLFAQIDQTFGQEMELSFSQFFWQFAPQEYWDRQSIPTPSGPLMRQQYRHDAPHLPKLVQTVPSTPPYIFQDGWPTE